MFFLVLAGSYDGHAIDNHSADEGHGAAGI